MDKPKYYGFILNAVKIYSKKAKISILDGFDYFIGKSKGSTKTEITACKNYFRFKTAVK